MSEFFWARHTHNRETVEMDMGHRLRPGVLESELCSLSWVSGSGPYSVPVSCNGVRPGAPSHAHGHAGSGSPDVRREKIRFELTHQTVLAAVRLYSLRLPATTDLAVPRMEIRPGT